MKSEFNNPSVDLPQNRKKYTNIEHELLSRYNGKAAITINLTSNANNTKTRNIPSSRKSAAVRTSIGKYKTSGRPKIGISSGVIQALSMRPYRR
jgi:hypothetical protein